MKKLFTKHISVLRLLTITGCAAGCFLVPNVLHAQTYYSQFQNPQAGPDYAVYNPSGEGCMATPIQNPSLMADGYGQNDLDNTFAYFSANNLTKPYDCDTTSRYKFDVALNFSNSNPSILSLAAGADVGVKIRVPTGISKDSLGKYIVIGTYLVDAGAATLQEYRTGDSLKGRGLDPNSDGTTWIIHFTTLKPMNALDLSIDPRIIQLNVNFQFQVFYAYGTINDNALPAQIANFKAAVSGKNVNLSWQSLTETNVKGYRIERSSDGGNTYIPVGLVVAKGNNNSAINYAYNDNGVTDGKYLYRLVIIDKSGTFKSSSSVAATISGQGQFLLYPTVIKAGQNVTVKTSETGDVTVHVFDGTGRLVKQQRINSKGQFNIATSGLTTGIYTVKIVSANGNVSQSRIMVN